MTFQTALNPTKPARPNALKLSMKAGPVSLPRASVVPIPAVVRPTVEMAFSHGVATTFFSSILTAGLGRDMAGAGAAMGGAGHITSFLYVTRAPRTTSSLRLMLKRPWSPMLRRNLSGLAYVGATGS